MASTPTPQHAVATDPAARRRHPWRRALAALLAIVLLGVLCVGGYAWYEYHRLTGNLTTSDAVAAANGTSAPVSDSLAGENILVVGLDSRDDENGRPLSPQIYAALHAGDSSIGGLNGNVLMVVHFPKNGGKATIVSIPRDDFVDLAGCPDGQCQGKIKQAYGLGYDAESKKQPGHTTGMTAVQIEQQRRDAGRAAEIRTVSAFLGGIRIDHYVEVTMVAFYDIAKAVQPITVCVKENTVDTFSGANFKAGVQQIDASQALAFVRQRRDTSNPSLQFTDLDRERRQQAFIASLAHQLRQTGTLANPLTLDSLVDVASQNMAVDSGLDLLDLAKQAVRLDDGGFALYTLPVERFGVDKYHEDANFVDLGAVRAMAKRLLTDPAPAAEPAPAPTATPTATATSAGPAAATHSSSALPSAVAGTADPAPTQLSVIDGSGVPCVK